MKQNLKTDTKKLPITKPLIKKKELKSKQSTWYRYVILTVILLISWFLYQPTLRHGFTNWDDPTYVLENNQVKKLNSENIKYFFSKASEYNYHPLTMIS